MLVGCLLFVILILLFHVFLNVLFLHDRSDATDVPETELDADELPDQGVVFDDIDAVVDYGGGADDDHPNRLGNNCNVFHLIKLSCILLFFI